ncbi:uncharacterized protein PHALS_05112 [Plasmopara halstedii]|uniref:Uncharacterized protein n=1 Tax=Plasmopara halstedii TaxID=4781 RepID=A0A0P1B134_PLAHL|nr:uncharacterized protein PHALS_05112 [Plasmopara halstedii]CEG47776.1 hypothetical protein PHALS_05112 [Plasmopara halstedii]|eukprot:XP_024584145.1 hypothetical protein PHALS_05112 [Plasmopara halstedii]
MDKKRQLQSAFAILTCGLDTFEELLLHGLTLEGCMLLPLLHLSRDHKMRLVIWEPLLVRQNLDRSWSSVQTRASHRQGIPKRWISTDSCLQDLINSVEKVPHSDCMRILQALKN